MWPVIRAKGYASAEDVRKSFGMSIINDTIRARNNDLHYGYHNKGQRVTTKRSMVRVIGRGRRAIE